MADATSLRKEHKAKKPREFMRQDSHKKQRVGKRWRKPRGLHSKMRLEKRGYRKKVKPGYRSPHEIREKIGDKEVVVVMNDADLNAIGCKKQYVIVGRKVGWKNKQKLLEHAIKANITIANFKDASAYIKEKEDARKTAKAAKEKQKKVKEGKKAAVLKKEKEEEAKKKDKVSKKEEKKETSTDEKKEVKKEEPKDKKEVKKDKTEKKQEKKEHSPKKEQSKPKQ